jgi:hypothetical protein
MDIPLVHIPTKLTEDVDFMPQFSAYIAEQYQEDPLNYQQQITALSRLRQDIKGAGKDTTGRDILYRCNIFLI